MIKIVYNSKSKLDVEKWGFGALRGTMLLLRIMENNKIDAYFRSG